MHPTTSADFKTKLSTSTTPIVVDFFAEWCGPCKMLSPIIESLLPEFEGKLLIMKVDVDEASDLAQEYAITSVPTMVFFKDGKEVERMSGFQSKETLAAKFNGFIG